MNNLWSILSFARRFISAPPRARTAMLADRLVPLKDHHGDDAIIKASLQWLCRSQDMSKSRDDGFARHFSLLDGWSASYPETSGYIVPTFLEAFKRTGQHEFASRAEKCLNWLVSIQFENGAIQGGMVDQTPRVPVTFNTGQVLLGLCAGAKAFENPTYLLAARKAAQWLCETQDADGCWRRFSTPFAAPGEKSYETHVSWALIEAERIDPGLGFGHAALKQVEWALTNQTPNGWFRHNDLSDDEHPLTHTIGYALRGLIEAHRWSPRPDLLTAATRTADHLLTAVRSDGYLPGRLSRDWSASVDWCCLTGNVQIAYCLFALEKITGREQYAETALRLNRYVKRTVTVRGDADIAGGVKGSFPVDGDYGRFQYLNWPAKFLIDSLWAEECFLERKKSLPAPSPLPESINL